MNLENLKKIAAVVFLFELICRIFLVRDIWRSVMDNERDMLPLLFIFLSITILGFVGIFNYFVSNGKKSTLFKANMGYYVATFPFIIATFDLVYTYYKKKLLHVFFSNQSELWTTFLFVTTVMSLILSFILLYKMHLEYRNRNYITKDETGNSINIHTISRTRIRALTYIIDLFGRLFFYAGFQLFFEKFFSTDEFGNLRVPTGFIMLFIVFSSVIYYIFFEILFGQTWGKMFTNTFVGNEHAERPSAGQIIARSFARHIPFNVLSFLFNRNWHDNISKTYIYNAVHPDDEVINIEFDAEKEIED